MVVPLLVLENCGMENWVLKNWVLENWVLENCGMDLEACGMVW